VCTIHCYTDPCEDPVKTRSFLLLFFSLSVSQTSLMIYLSSLDMNQERVKAFVEAITKNFIQKLLPTLRDFLGNQRPPSPPAALFVQLWGGNSGCLAHQHTMVHLPQRCTPAHTTLLSPLSMHDIVRSETLSCSRLLRFYAAGRLCCSASALCPDAIAGFIMHRDLQSLSLCTEL
jgi:hypothetical protein